MVQFRAGELSQWVSKLWENGIPDGVITGISNDSRTIQPGNLYVAILGENYDGHRFLQQAFEKGAAGALISDKEQWSNDPVLRVNDTIRGLQAIARGYRKKWIGTTVGITGSVGKTTVKEMCAAVLSEHGATHHSKGNLNNHIGLPLSMLHMPCDTRYGVFEIGMNRMGEIGALAHLLHPHAAIITDIGGVHLENFNSIDDIAREKSRLAEQVPSSGKVILDRDCNWYSTMRTRICANVITISLEGVADYVGRKAGDDMLDVNGCRYAMPLPGEHTMRNALRAIALGLELGMEPPEIARGLAKLELPPMRWEKTSTRDVQFINDAYNANPLSMRAVLKTFAGLSAKGKKWVVIGGMHELGISSEEEHTALGEYIDQLGFDGIITVGELGKKVVCKSAHTFFQCQDTTEAAKILKENLGEGDHVLLKASRGEQLERVLHSFKEI